MTGRIGARRSTAGFTLIEVTVAIAILALSLTTLIVLHTRYTKAYLADVSLMRAALIAREVMTAMELEKEAPEEGVKNGRVTDLLLDIPEDTSGSSRKKELSSWHYVRRVTNIDVQDVKDALRRVDLTIQWGDSPSDSYSVVYFMRPKNN